MASFSTSIVKSIGLPVLGYYFVPMELKEKFIVDSVEIKLTVFQIPPTLLKQAFISSSGRNFW